MYTYDSTDLVHKEYWVPKLAAFYGIVLIFVHLSVLLGCYSEFTALHLALTLLYLLLNLYCVSYCIVKKLAPALQTGLLHWSIASFFALLQLVGEAVAAKPGSDIGFVFVFLPVCGQFWGLLSRFSFWQVNCIILVFSLFLLAADIIGLRYAKR